MIFYITTHELNKQYSKQIKLLFEKTNYEYYFVYGQNQNNKIEPFIEVPCEESYENLPSKTFWLIEHFLNKTSHDRMFKMDDNTFIDFKQFNQIDYKADYVGMLVSYPEDLKSSIYHWYKIQSDDYKQKKKTFPLTYAQGSFYSLTRSAAHVCFSKGEKFFKNTPETYLGEDVKIGMCLQDNNITKQNILIPLDIMYEVSSNMATIHPVHHIIFDKLTKALTSQEKINILREYNFLNENFKRDIFLNKLIKSGI